MFTVFEFSFIVFVKFIIVVIYYFQIINRIDLPKNFYIFILLIDISVTESLSGAVLILKKGGSERMEKNRCRCTSVRGEPFFLPPCWRVSFLKERG